MLTDSHHTSQICSCTSCFYESQSCDPSVQHMLREGSKVDRLYLGKYIPLRERNLLKKLVRTRAVYDDINCQLMAETCVDATYFIPRQHATQCYTRLADGERSSSLLELVDQNKRSPHQHHHSMEHCSCCSCGAIRVNKYPTQKRRHRHAHGHPHGGLSTSGMGRGRKSVRFKARPIQSEPCTCANKRSEMLRQHTRNVKLRPDYQRFERSIHFPGYENINSSNKRKHRKHYIQKHKISNSQLTQSEDKWEPKRKESRKTRVSKVSRNKRTETDKSDKKTSKTKEQPYKSYDLDETSFSIKKDSVAIFKDEIEKRRKHYFMKYINKYKPCQSPTPGCCYPGECNPNECCRIIQRRRRKRHRKERQDEYPSKKTERHNKMVDTLIKSQKATSQTHIENVTSETSSITSQTTRNKENSEKPFEKKTRENVGDVIPNIENIGNKSSRHAKTSTELKKQNRKNLEELKNKSQSKQQNVIKLASEKTSLGSFLGSIPRKRTNHKKNVIVKHRVSQTTFETHPSFGGRGFEECLCPLKLYPKSVKNKHPKSSSNKILAQHKDLPDVKDKDEVDIHADSKNNATQSITKRKKILAQHKVLPDVKLDKTDVDFHGDSKNIVTHSTTKRKIIDASSSHHKSRIRVEPKAAIDRIDLISCECINKDDKKNVSDKEQPDKIIMKSDIKTVRSKNTKHNNSRYKLPKISIATEHSEYKVKKHRLRKCLCSLKLTNRSTKDYQLMQNKYVSKVCDPSNCLLLNHIRQKQHSQRHMKRSKREYRKSKSTSSFTLSKSIKPKKVLSSFYPHSVHNEKRLPDSSSVTSFKKENLSKILKKGDHHRKSTSTILKHKNKSKFILPSVKECLCALQKNSNIQKSNLSANVTETASRNHKTTTKSTKFKPEKPKPIYKYNQNKGLKGRILQKSNSTFTHQSPPKSKRNLAKSTVTQQKKYPFPTPKKIIKHKKAIPVVDLKIPRQIVRYGSNISFSIEFSKYTYNKKPPLKIYTVSRVTRNKCECTRKVSEIPSQVRKTCDNLNITLPLVYNWKSYNLYPDICMNKSFGNYESEKVIDQNCDKRTIKNFNINSCFQTISEVSEKELLPKENYSKLLKAKKDLQSHRQKEVVRVGSRIDLSVVFSQHRSAVINKTHLQHNRPVLNKDTIQSTSKNCITQNLNTGFENRINVQNRQSIIKIYQGETASVKHNLAIVKFPKIFKEKNKFQQTPHSMRTFKNNKNLGNFAVSDETNNLNMTSNRQFGLQNNNTRLRTQKKCRVNTHQHLKLIQREEKINITSPSSMKQNLPLTNIKTEPNQNSFWKKCFCWMKVKIIDTRNENFKVVTADTETEICEIKNKYENCASTVFIPSALSEKIPVPPNSPIKVKKSLMEKSNMRASSCNLKSSKLFNTTRMKTSFKMYGNKINNLLFQALKRYHIGKRVENSFTKTSYETQETVTDH